MNRSALLVVAAVLLCYVKLFLGHSTFVFDDERFIPQNAAVREFESAWSFFADPTTVDPNAWTGIYRPLRTLDFAVDWKISGGSARWFHFRNVLYHAAAALLVLHLLRRWKAGEPAATIGALVFALHPVQVETAGWITSRGDLLCLVFFLGALALHQRAKGYDRWFAGAAGLLVLALFSKEAAVMFAPAAALADFFFRDERKIRRTLARWPQYLIYAGIATAYFFLWSWMHTSRGAPRWHVETRWGDSFLGTLLTMSRGFVYYLRLIFVPVDMAQDYYVMPVKSIDPLTALCAAIAIAVLGFATWRLGKGGGAFSFAVLWSAITIFPTSNIPAPVGITTAERFLYTPMVGIALALGLLLARFWGYGRPGRIGVATLLTCLGVVSIDRTTDWMTDSTLWQATLERFEAPRALEWRSETLRQEGADLRLSAKQARERGDPSRAQDYDAQGFAKLVAAERDQTRLVEFWESLPSAAPAVAVAKTNRALTWYNMGRLDDALAVAEEMLAHHPVLQLLPRAHHIRALVHHDRGDYRAAAGAIHEALHAARVWSPELRRDAAAINQKLATWYNDPARRYRARMYEALRNSFRFHPTPEVEQALREVEEGYQAEKQRLEGLTRKDPSDASAWMSLAVLEAMHGFYDNAARIFDRLLQEDQLGRIPELLYPYAEFHWEQRDTVEGYQAAAAIYEELAAADPTAARVALARVAAALASLKESLAK